MKKLILASLIAASLSANALTIPDVGWVVTTQTADPVTFTILPLTAENVTMSDGLVESRTVVESYNKSSPTKVTRNRARVTGCKNSSGKVLLANMDLTMPNNQQIFEWDRDGTRVFDMVAVRVCIATHMPK
jgi:hypothetical protein